MFLQVCIFCLIARFSVEAGESNADLQWLKTKQPKKSSVPNFEIISNSACSEEAGRKDANNNNNKNKIIFDDYTPAVPVESEPECFVINGQRISDPNGVNTASYQVYVQERNEPEQHIVNDCVGNHLQTGCGGRTGSW